MKTGPPIALLGLLVLYLNHVTNDIQPHWTRNWIGVICALLFAIGTVLTGAQKGRKGLGYCFAPLSMMFGFGFFIILMVPKKELDQAHLKPKSVFTICTTIIGLIIFSYGASGLICAAFCDFPFFPPSLQHLLYTHLLSIQNGVLAMIVGTLIVKRDDLADLVFRPTPAEWTQSQE